MTFGFKIQTAIQWESPGCKEFSQFIVHITACGLARSYSLTGTCSKQTTCAPNSMPAQGPSAEDQLIYVGDSVRFHDFGLLRKLVFPDGTIPKCQHFALPTRDCLFKIPLLDNKTILKLWNVNKVMPVCPMNLA